LLVDFLDPMSGMKTPTQFFRHSRLNKFVHLGEHPSVSQTENDSGVQQCPFITLNVTHDKSARGRVESVPQFRELTPSGDPNTRRHAIHSRVLFKR
jgi:hypothetical protein